MREIRTSGSMRGCRKRAISRRACALLYTPEGKDGEIRVRMGKFYFQPWVGRGATTGVFGRGYAENKRLRLAPREEHRSEHANGEFRRRDFLRGVNQGRPFGFETIRTVSPSRCSGMINTRLG